MPVALQERGTRGGGGEGGRRACVWHPYDTVPPNVAPLPVASAAGVRLRLTDGTELVDGMASWWAAIHGYAHPVLDDAVTRQLEQMAHVMFGGLTHAPAEDLGERLVGVTPACLDHVFFADSGSVAVEVAIKMCLQAQQGRGMPACPRLLAVHGGYHGDTFGAMAVCDPVDGMHTDFDGVLAEHVFAPTPPSGFDAPLDEAWADQVARLVDHHADELAGVIVEPIVQGAGSMRIHSPECLRFLRRLCFEYDLLLVLDEIATGFGRTGALFAAEHAAIDPDVMTVGKALTGGYVTLAATLRTASVAKAIAQSPAGCLVHGPTFMANPLACAVASASLDLLLRGNRHLDVLRIERTLKEARKLPRVSDVRVLGVVELAGPVDVEAATAAAVGEGVWLRPFRNIVYVMPPYVIDDDELARLARGVLAAVAAGGRR